MKLVLAWALAMYLIPTAKASPSLVGVWQSDCAPVTRHSFKTTVTLSEGRAVLVTQLFADQGCATNSISLTLDGDYSTGADFGEGYEVNLTPATVKMTLRLPEVVDYYNAHSGCGLTNWAIDVAQDVSGRFCNPNQMPLVGQITYDIYNIADGILQFGGIPVRLDTVDPMLRPTGLSGRSFRRIDL